MRRSALVPLLLLAAVLPFVETLVAQPPEAGTKYALVVGIDEYADGKRLPKLNYAEADAQALAETLRKAKFQVTLLLGKDATKGKIEDAFHAILKKPNGEDKLTGKDSLLFAFAGHGQQFKPAGETDDVPFLCPVGCNALQAGTQVRLNGLLTKAGDATVGRALFLIDACRTDPGQRGGVTGNAVSLKAQTEVLFAAANGQKAREHADAGGKGNGHGLFMSEVIAAFAGEAKNKRGEVTWNGLVTHITGEVTAKSKSLFPALEDSQHQTPHRLGSLAGDVVLSAAIAPPKERAGGDVVKFQIADGMAMEFCWIPPGDAQLGSPKAEREAVLKQLGDKEEPEWLKAEAEGVRGKHVEKAGFWLGKYAVTQAEWTAVMGTVPFWFHKDGKSADAVKGLVTSRFPAEGVSWDDAQEFLGKVNQRAGIAAAFGKGAKLVLPHEDRWEYAYRGKLGNGRAYYWGDALNGDKANCDGYYPFGTTDKGKYLKRPSVVGAYASQAKHPWGLCDMSGNVWQWCENEYSSDSKSRVLRGGSWDYGAGNCRAARRSSSAPAARVIVEFRVCAVLD